MRTVYVYTNGRVAIVNWAVVIVATIKYYTILCKLEDQKGI